MKRISITFVFFVVFFVGSQAQIDYGCDGDRYLNPVFNDFDKTTVVYGKNVNPDGDSVTLRMDIYEPVDDAAEFRPLIVFAHGGSFIGGMRQDLDDLCQRMTRHGWVAATIDYRLLSIFGGIPSAEGGMDIAIKASHDMKGAIRWFRHHAYEDGNALRIDPEQIFCGGYSAGAVVALTTGILDEEELTEPFIADIVEANGGFRGSTGDTSHLVYGEHVNGIVNLSGATYDTLWLDVEDPMLLSYHGTADDIVPYGYDFVTVFGQPIVELHGSGSLHAHAEKIGLQNYLYSVQGGDHVEIYFNSSYEDELNAYRAATDSIFTLWLCGSIVNSFEEEFSLVKVAPNPVKDLLYIDGLEAGSRVTLYNTAGEIVYNGLAQAGRIDMSGFPSGMYYLDVQGKRQEVKKIIKM